MRNFLAIIFIAALAFGGILFFARGKTSPQTSIDGSIDATGNNATTASQAVDAKTLLGTKRNTKGNLNAKVTLVEFSDYQCPYCKVANEEINKLLDKYNDKVLFVYRHFPLTMHPLSQKAAEAAEAAGAQGKDKFWAMHDKIFTNQSSLSEDSFEKFASEIGLDVEKFKQDFKSTKYTDLVTGDLQDGETLKIQGTPTFFVNNKQVQLSNFNDLENYINKELSK